MKIIRTSGREDKEITQLGARLGQVYVLASAASNSTRYVYICLPVKGEKRLFNLASNSYMEQRDQSRIVPVNSELHIWEDSE